MNINKKVAVTQWLPCLNIGPVLQTENHCNTHVHSDLAGHSSWDGKMRQSPSLVAEH